MPGLAARRAAGALARGAGSLPQPEVARPFWGLVVLIGHALARLFLFLPSARFNLPG